MDEVLMCRECREELAAVRYHDSFKVRCLRCGRVMDHSYEYCGNCILQPPLYRRHVSYSRYEGVLKNLILSYKYGTNEGLKELFRDYLLEVFTGEIDEFFDYIIPVPADRKRQKERKYNPVLEITAELSQRLGIRLLRRRLIKIKKTPEQAGLNRAQRLKNLDGAFKLKRGHQLKGKKVLLIDDVYTTGTTVHKCVELLVEHDVDVVVLTLARS